MRIFNELPEHCASWKEYLRRDFYFINDYPEQNNYFLRMYQAHMEPFYERISPTHPNAILISYILPAFVKDRYGDKYGTYGFRIYDKQTGNRSQVKFDKFGEWELCKDRGTCGQAAVFPEHIHALALQWEIKESSKVFWEEAESIKRKWEPFMPKTIDNDQGNKERHRFYLGSRQWFEIASSIRSRDENHCRHCGKYDRALDVHHRTYARWGEESPDDLISLCHPCHQKEHGKETGHSQFNR